MNLVTFIQLRFVELPGYLQSFIRQHHPGIIPQPVLPAVQHFLHPYPFGQSGFWKHNGHLHLLRAMPHFRFPQLMLAAEALANGLGYTKFIFIAPLLNTA